MATMEEAQACPMCKQPGEIRIERPAGDGKLLSIYCGNKRCEWYDTPWNVSVRADGSIPDPSDHIGPKEYIGFDFSNETYQKIINELTFQEMESRKGRVDPV